MPEALDVLIVSLGSTGGLRAVDEELLGSLRRAGARAAIAFSDAPSAVRTLMLTDLRWARAARRAASAELERVRPRALIYSTTTAALLWPQPGAIRFDAPAAANRGGRHGLWQRPLESRRLREAPLLLPQSEGALEELPVRVRRSLGPDDAFVLPVPIEPSSPFGVPLASGLSSSSGLPMSSGLRSSSGPPTSSGLRSSSGSPTSFGLRSSSGSPTSSGPSLSCRQHSPPGAALPSGPAGSSGPPARDIAAITYAANPAKKGLDVVLDAWRRARRPGEEMIVVGAELERLRALGYALPAEGVRVTGMLDQTDYRALLRRARTYVCAARREDYGIAQLEALADGCMLVTTPSPGPYVALAMARELDPRLVGDNLAKALRSALDEPTTGYAERALSALAPLRRAEVDRMVAEKLLPRLLG
ncbi:MAG TPA: glycosyltransferase [Solirubrobacteraceae bacterium]|nr:glycosyltransferase [Solirubrobacteraceae bacterium]